MPFAEYITEEADHASWREQVVQAMAESLDMERYGVKALYLIGSVKTREAGPCSDIDLLAHCLDDPSVNERLVSFFEGWGICLTLINNQKTGYQTHGSLIDLHIITDEDIRQGNSFAIMINNPVNGARLLKKSTIT